MKIVIQCSGVKTSNAGRLVAKNGRAVTFVAHPEYAPASETAFYAAPDGLFDQDLSWRQMLEKYNETPDRNPLLLLPAGGLYARQIYARLAEKFGDESLYILSAGWGLIRSDFLTPDYDVTFTASAEKYKRRNIGDKFLDFYHLDDNKTEPLAFLGGKAYLPLFCSLTKLYRGNRIVFFNSKYGPSVPGCIAKRFHTAQKTNWYYSAAQALIDGSLSID